MNINTLIAELVKYGIKNELIDPIDEVYTVNKLIEFFGCTEYVEPDEIPESREVSAILNDMLNYASENGIMEEDTITYRDLLDTKIMGLITPPPSVIRSIFKEKYDRDPKEATDWYYRISIATNYIREDRIRKDEKWTSPTEFGDIDITINLSKPEKDPRDIAKAGQAKKSGYPACLLCKENEGYSGHFSHPARQNHRIIPLELQGQDYFIQYSPYVYYNEHCIVFNAKHTPMKIDREVFAKLTEFTGKFPHYIVGSNADLPIVGGSILSHDHFQGGSYEFPMARAEYESNFTFEGYPNINAGIVNWPMSVIRLQATKEELPNLVDLSDKILGLWRKYTDEDAFILSETDGVPHNTITPIARRRGDLYELDLVLRNNITTDECPLGYYHPHPQYHHIKKENIGLIEVMGLAVLPARLKGELKELADAIIEGKDISSIENISKHAEWVSQWLPNYDVTPDNIQDIIRKEVGIVFSKVLECAGVYKCTDEGREAFMRFVRSVGIN